MYLYIYRRNINSVPMDGCSSERGMDDLENLLAGLSLTGQAGQGGQNTETHVSKQGVYKQ